MPNGNGVNGNGSGSPGAGTIFIVFIGISLLFLGIGALLYFVVDFCSDSMPQWIRVMNKCPGTITAKISDIVGEIRSEESNCHNPVYRALHLDECIESDRETTEQCGDKVNGVSNPDIFIDENNNCRYCPTGYIKSRFKGTGDRACSRSAPPQKVDTGDKFFKGEFQGYIDEGFIGTPIIEGLSIPTPPPIVSTVTTAATTAATTATTAATTAATAATTAATTAAKTATTVAKNIASTISSKINPCKDKYGPDSHRKIKVRERDQCWKCPSGTKPNLLATWGEPDDPNEKGCREVIKCKKTDEGVKLEEGDKFRGPSLIGCWECTAGFRPNRVAIRAAHLAPLSPIVTANFLDNACINKDFDITKIKDTPAFVAAPIFKKVV